MTLASPRRTAIVFSCDEAYAFLARGLVLSLAEAGYPDADTSIVLMDIGCGDATRAWIKDRGVEVVPFDPAIIPPRVAALIKRVQWAQVMRPWLPEMLPDYERFVWLDSDIWLQNGEVLGALAAGAKAVSDAVMLAPGVSHYNFELYTDLEDVYLMQRRWYESCYEVEFARQAAKKLHFSSGVFGLRSASPLWALWRREIEFLYPLAAERDPKLLHLAEQIALNAIMIRTQLFVGLDPLYNFHCNSGGARRASNGRVMTTALLPSRELGVVHLANWSMVREHYLENKLLYRDGDYLTPEERERIGLKP